MKSKNSGQMTIEAVLIISIMVSVMYAASRVLGDQQILSRLVEQPWGYVAGMIENGIWDNPQRGRDRHPNDITRHGTPLGDDP